jgi:transposase
MREKILSLYEAGYGAPTIAQKIGISQTSVYRWLHRSGIVPKANLPVRHKRWLVVFTEEQDKEIARLYKEGRSLSQIVQQFGHCISAVRNALVRQGISINSRGNHFRKFSEEEVSDIVSLYQLGWSQTKIGEKYGADQTIISKLLRNAGIVPVKRRLEGVNHGMWKGGITNLEGYRFIRLPVGHPFRSMAHRSGYVAEHRLVMAGSLGRCLLDNETVHHLDGDKLNNVLENLQLRQTKHGKGQVAFCLSCGSLEIGYREV